jgi:Bacterial Ig-like domain (group 3)
MKAIFRKKVLTGVGAVALVGGTILATAGSALATVPTTISNDPGATLGGIDFFNSAGVQVTTGSLSAPFAAFAVAQNAPSVAPSFKKMVENAYTPVIGQLPAQWSGEQLAHASTAYPVATPADLASLPSATPVYTGAANDKSLTTYIGDFPNSDTSTTDGYKGIYVIRIQEATTGDYAKADISIDTTAGTWTQQDGTFQLDATTTTLTPTPGSPQTPGTAETLSAHVADTTTPATIPVGTVAFFDSFSGSPVQIGTTQAVDGSGNASVPWTSSVLGTHPLTAVFTPTTIGTGFFTSTGSSSFVIANLDATNTALSVTPGATTAFAPEDLKATITDTTTGTTIPTGSVSFFDNTSTLLGTAPVNGSGVAEIPAFTGFAQGAHSVTAVYTPTAGSTFAGSNGGPVTFSDTAPACPNGEASTLCTDPQTVEATVAAGTITITTPYSPGNPLNLGALQLNSNGTLLSANAQFGNTTNTASEIFVTDTRAGDPNWTATVDSGAFTSASTSTPIDGQYAGLTNVTVEGVGGNALNSGNVTVTNNPAATTGVVPGGHLGIGGSVAGTPGSGHVFANTTAGGDGSVGFIGTFTLNAPTSTAAGLYVGTVTFTVG